MWFILVVNRSSPSCSLTSKVLKCGRPENNKREFMSVCGWLTNLEDHKGHFFDHVRWSLKENRSFPARWLNQFPEAGHKGVVFNQFNHQQLGTCRFNPLTLLFNLQNPSNWWFTDLGMFDMGDGHKIYGNVHGKLISKLWGTVSYIQGNRYEQENARLEHQNWDSSFKIVLWMSIYIYIYA